MTKYQKAERIFDVVCGFAVLYLAFYSLFAVVLDWPLENRPIWLAACLAFVRVASALFGRK